jgi:hypothetical protein
VTLHGLWLQGAREETTLVRKRWNSDDLFFVIEGGTHRLRSSGVAAVLCAAAARAAFVGHAACEVEGERGDDEAEGRCSKTHHTTHVKSQRGG